MCVRFIHFSRDLTFYYVCALRLEGEGEANKKVFLLVQDSFLFRDCFAGIVGVCVCALCNMKEAKPAKPGEDIREKKKNFRSSGRDFDVR